MSTRSLSLSVITPSYNHAQFIRQTIDSVFDQHYPAVEHIVIDGASTDGTQDILLECQRTYGDRFRWISEPDSGQADAFNKGLAMATGEVIGWQNSDDYYLRDAFTTSLELLQRDPDLAGVYGDHMLVDAAGNRLQVVPAGVMDRVRLLNTCYIPNQSAFLRRDALVACGGLRAELHYALDWDLWLRLAARFRLQYLPGVRGALRVLETAKTNMGLLRSRLEVVNCVERFLAQDDLPGELLAEGRAALERLLMDALQIALAFDDRQQSSALTQRIMELYGPSPNWTYFCKRTVMRRVMTDLWYGRLDPELVAAVPRRALSLILQQDVEPAVIRQTTSMVYLFAALEELRNADGYAGSHFGPYLLRAFQTDRTLLTYPGTFVALLRLFLGNRKVDALAPAFLKIRSVRAQVEARQATVAGEPQL